MSQSKHTRRDFLKTTAAVSAASMAAPYYFTAAATADEPKSDKLVVAAIGVGGRGTEIGKQAARLGRMVACADVTWATPTTSPTLKRSAAIVITCKSICYLLCPSSDPEHFLYVWH